MRNLKNRVNEQTKLEQTHGHRDRLAVARREGVEGLSEKGEGTKKYGLGATKYSWKCKPELKEYSE